jgi:hypothetical protein
MAGQMPQSEFRNAILICVDCNEEFVFTASAQQYFADRGFSEPPKRCKVCYNEFRKNQPSSDDGDHVDPSGPMPPPSMRPGPVQRAPRN